jgi:hypothetical protein
MKILKISIMVILSILTAILLLSMILRSNMTIYIDENGSYEISNHSVIAPIYVDGTKCIFMESDNHGALSCNWKKTA